MYPKYPRIIPDRDKWRDHYLDEDVLVTLSNGDTIYLEKGYRFDGPSIPWFFKPFIKEQWNDRYTALVHDYMLDRSPWTRYNRKFQDEQYQFFVEKPEYFTTEWRVKWFPRGVKIWGFLTHTLWGDNRGL